MSSRFASIAAIIASIFLATQPLQADPRADAEWIVEKLVGPDVMQAMLAASEDALKLAILGGLRSNPSMRVGASSEVWVVNEFTRIFREQMQVGMRPQLIKVYQSQFSASQLAELRTFLSTDAGRALASRQSTLIKESADVGRRLGEKAGGEAAKAIAIRLAREGDQLIANESDLRKLRQMFPAR